MPSIRTANNRSRAWRQKQPARCAKHGLPYQGGGLVLAAGLGFVLFECPRPGCKNFKLVEENDGAVPDFSSSPL